MGITFNVRRKSRMEKQQLIEKINELLKVVETMKLDLEILIDPDVISFLRNEIRIKHIEINDLEEELDLVKSEQYI